jgi:hypothetical protein
MDAYLFDDMVTEFLTKLSEYKSKQCYIVFTLIYNINSIPGNNLILNLDLLESSLIDIITCDDIETDKMIDQFLNVILSSTIKYVSMYGIYLNTTSLSIVIEAMSSLKTYLTLDVELLDPVEDILNNENDDNITITAKLLANYSTLGLYDWLEVIDSVSDDYLDNMLQYIKYRRDISNKNINVHLFNLANKLIEVSPEFKNTLVVKLILTNEIDTEFTHDMYLNQVYSVLDTYTDPYLIQYEIVALYYLASDTKTNILEEIKENFNFNYIDILTNDYVLTDVVITTTIDLSKKVLAEITND